MPKSQTSRPTKNKKFIMQNVSIHKQKLVAIIIAALVLILLFLPWQKQSAQGFQSTNYMGYTIWGGIICAIGAAGAVVTCLLGNKLQPFTKQTKIIAIVCFAIVFLFALIVAIASSGSQQAQTNEGYIVEIKKSAGIGAWLGMVVGLAGIAWTSGILGQLMQQKPAGPMPAGPPPPPPPPPPTPTV
jgi:hypothetical protein